MVFLKSILLSSFILVLTSCATKSEKQVIQEYISNKYIEKNASIQSLDYHSEILDQSSSLKLKNKLEEKEKALIYLKLKNNIAYYKINSFNENITKEIKKRCKNNKDSIILDLRDNTGGYLSEAISLVDLFLDSGVIIKEITRKKDYKIYKAKKESLCINTPLAILVNKQSASASEIVAGSLQYHKKAIIIGDKTFGKGTIQEIISLDKNRILKLTVSKYLLAKDKKIENIGITPDILIQDSKDKNIDHVLQIGFDLLK